MQININRQKYNMKNIYNGAVALNNQCEAPFAKKK